jgi:hypothetical protein
MKSFLQRAYHALPPVRRAADIRASKELTDQTTSLYADALKASEQWPLAWRRALVNSLPAVAGLPSAAKRATAFQSRIDEVASIVERGSMAARMLYGLPAQCPQEQLDREIKAGPAWWNHVEQLVAQHIIQRSTVRKAASDLLESLAAQQDATSIDTAICDRPAPAGAISGAWAKTIAKFQAAGNAS